MKRLGMWLFIAALAFISCGMNAWASESSADFKEYRSWEEKGEKAGKIFVKGKNSRLEF